MIDKKSILTVIILLVFAIGCTDDNKPKNEGPGDESYGKNDTLVYLTFDGDLLDKSIYEHEIDVQGEPSYVYNRDSSVNSAAFFDGQTSLSFQLDAHDTIEFDFWFAPFIIAKGQSIMDYMDGLFSISISDIDTSYVNSFGAATYMVSATSDYPEKVTRKFELRPYPREFDEFDLASFTWKHVQIMVGQGIKPTLYINDFKVGEFDNELQLSGDRTAVIVIGANHETNHFFHGKIDDFVIRNFSISPGE
jgi:hypothetical protein